VRVLVGVTGGIAAFKAAELVRRLRAEGHEVRCALTRAGAAFVSPLTLEVLTGREVYQEEYLSPGNGGAEAHIAAARWADVVCIAPATAHTLARLALGLADDFLSTTALAFGGPLVLAPAMHSEMWAKPVVQQHLATLRERGGVVVGPAEGALASGEVGWGRMAEPEAVAEAIAGAARRRDLAGTTVLLTAGPTHEPLDPVRFLGNRSSGRMGFALAAAAAQRGAQVELVAGPVALETPPGVERVDVGTALEMRDAVYARAPRADLVIMAAAVADFRARHVQPHKIKREAGVPALELEPNPDILAGLAAVAPRALRVGFAAETERLEERAAAKLERQEVDFLVANDVSRADVGFGSEWNEVTVWRRDRPPVEFSRRRKAALAGDLLDLFAAALVERARHPAGAPR
jgi:phosphopantothenoylcysteine decarboxylase/phosphopantothenate--cysteine ligase